MKDKGIGKSKGKGKGKAKIAKKEKREKLQANTKRKHDEEQEIMDEIDQQEEQSQQITWKHQQQNPEEEQHSINEDQADHNNSHVEQQQVQQEQENGQEEIGEGMDLLAHNERNLEEYQEEIGNTGVIYMSRVPPYMTPNFIRKLLAVYEVRRIYLLPESDWARNNRIKRGGSKRICFREGWIEFEDKRVAKMVALTLNGQRMVAKKGSFYSQDIWNLKYLPKFRWHNLTQKLAHEQRLKSQTLKLQLAQQRKLQQYYTNQSHKSKQITGIIKQKISKGKDVKNMKNRSYGQMTTLQEQQD